MEIRMDSDFRTAEAKRPRMGQDFQNGGQMISKLGLWQDVKLRAILRHPRSQINHAPHVPFLGKLLEHLVPHNKGRN